MRTIGVVTVGRSDFGIYLPILRKIEKDPDLCLYLIVSGMHLSPEFGMTADEIETEGFHINQKVDMLLSSDTPQGIAKSMGLGTIGFAQAFEKSRPDILLVLGDRFEMHAAVCAALPFRIPIAHIHGGEITLGAMDDALRHSITKMSHLHFVSTEEYACRVQQMGEEPWRICVSGAPALDHLSTIPLLSKAEIAFRYYLSLSEPPILVTFHPVTLEHENTRYHITELLDALHTIQKPVVFTFPNADTNGRIIISQIKEFTENHRSAWMVSNFGTQGYFGMMSHAAAMVGNSSSGIIEAPFFKLPVVNIGTRQQGRIRAANVIDTGYDRKEILQGIQKALDPDFRKKLDNLKNPYGVGRATDIIVNRLKEVQIDENLMKKRFYESVSLSDNRQNTDPEGDLKEVA